MPWNPIGTGDRYGNPSEVLAHSNEGTTIYVKSRPKQWALNNVPCECTFEHWIRLNGNAVEVENRLTNARSDTTQYPAFDQELPAIYTIGKLHRLVTYSGTNPYSGEPVTRLEPLLEGSFFQATEQWAALVNDAGWGLGVYSPEIQRFYGKFFGERGVGATSDFSTGYMAVNTPEILDHEIVFSYEYALVLGTVNEIRQYAFAQRRETSHIVYDFERSRDHWWYVNASGSWPRAGTIRLDLGRSDPYIVGPETLWSSVDVPKLFIRIAYYTATATATTAELFWRGPGQQFSGARSIRFRIIANGEFHTYELDLASVPSYAGAITQLRFDPAAGGDPGTSADVDYISVTPL
jgi:hypothetical protein